MLNKYYAAKFKKYKYTKFFVKLIYLKKKILLR